MKTPKRADVMTICDCGRQFSVPFDRVRDDITCPACGDVGRFSADRLLEIERSFGIALEEARKRKEASDPKPIGSAAVRRPAEGN